MSNYFQEKRRCHGVKCFENVSFEQNCWLLLDKQLPGRSLHNPEAVMNRSPLDKSTPLILLLVDKSTPLILLLVFVYTLQIKSLVTLELVL
jgi:hypothetical protein